MKTKSLSLIILVSLLIYGTNIFSQTAQEKIKILEKTNVSKLLEISKYQKKKTKKENELAIEKAKIEGWEIFINNPINNSYSELIRLDKEGNPIYFSTSNNGAGLTARTNHLYLGGSLGLNIAGQNMLAGEWDGGGVRYTHELFEGRVTQIDSPLSTSYHSTHVAGTIIGSDLVQGGNARGMAFKANLNSYDWHYDKSEVADAAANGLLISNHSYGYSPSSIPLYFFGKYDDDSLAFDDIMYNAPYYLFVAAAGNTRNDGINAADGGYDLLTGHSCSKNSIVVAAVNEQVSYTGPSSVVMSSFSSWGPTDDGRIKPDISAKGVNTFSAYDNNDSAYNTISGTSMAAPSVTGTLLLLQQYYNKEHDNFMLSSTLRGLALHTADEAGDNPGPDYEFGWGLINAKKAAELIKNDGVIASISENALSQGGTFTMSFKALGTEPLMATICWTDPAGNVMSSTINDFLGEALINDLDIRITQNGSTYYPWKLDPSNPSSAATQGDNVVDNIENIEINNPNGTYTLTVTHKGTLSGGLDILGDPIVIDHQNFSLILSGISFNDFYLTASNEKEIICETDDTAIFNLDLNTISNFNNDTVSFSTSGLPSGVTTVFNPLSLNSAGSFDFAVSNLSTLAAGIYPFIVHGQSSTENVALELELEILDSSFSPIVLTTPINNESSVIVNTNLNWVEDITAQEYVIEIATDISFTNIIETATVIQNSYQASLLNIETTYYWRVRPDNQCGIGTFSVPFNFTTTCELPSKTITFCDMTIIDFDSDGTNDGIINLYDEYNAIPGVTPISSTNGTWLDPNYNFALDTTTGDLHLWDLSTSSILEITHQFQLIDPSSTCTDDGVIITLNVIVGPFSGFAVPTVVGNDVNVEICDGPNDACGSYTDFDLYQTFLSVPSPHTNGIWSYEGSNPNFLGISENRYLHVNIPYEEGPPLVDEETFELIYTVGGTSPCSNSVETRVKVSVIRGVFAGNANTLNIGESELTNGDYDNDIDLLDDAYLVKEDIEGIWSEYNTNQLENPLDSFINLKEIYDNLVLTNPRFGCEEYEFTYFVDSRPTVCFSDENTITFRLFEEIRPFEQEEVEEICVGEENLSTLNLYDLITFTTENGVLYDYPSPDFTNWTFISGPSNLGLVSNTGELGTVTEDPNYTALGTIDISNLTNADAGTYVFEYIVNENYNCSMYNPMTNFPINAEIIYDTPEGCLLNNNYDQPSTTQSAQITLIIHPYNYPGEDTLGLEFCETEYTNSIDLITLLDTNGVDTIYQGSESHWIDLDTGDIIDNTFIIPEINGEQTFNFQFNITANNCLEMVDLTFTLYEQYKAGTNSTKDICIEDSAFELFDELGGSPDENGSWTGPNSYTSTTNLVDFDPETFESGEYTYTVPSNNLCEEHSAIVTVNIILPSIAGDDVQENVCKIDGQIDLYNLLDSDADTGGVFIDLDNTNALNGSIVDLSQLTNNSYSFQYDVQLNAMCSVSSSVITIVVEEVINPIIEDQTFCIGYGATLADLLITSSNNNYNWYDEIDDIIPLSQDVIIKDGEDYYVAAYNENDCESERERVVITLIAFGEEGCVSCINDGVSANNDGENDELELCGLPNIFPNFEIKIFNRYGNIVYNGNINSYLFNGESNVALTIGDQVPAGVYFYIFYPNDGSTIPFQGDFYLSR